MSQGAADDAASAPPPPIRGQRDELEVILQRMRSKGMRRTHWREAIVTALLRAPQPLSAQEVRQRVRQPEDGGEIDVVTVYRALQSFLEVGIASKSVFEDGVARFAIRKLDELPVGWVTDFECVTCGRRWPLEETQALARSLQFVPWPGDPVEVHVRGHCRDCREGLPDSLAEPT
ncbi:MAG: transcriptional repressor [Planctomycetaceae bacterium]|nr:transcriptional repressor [Planctomycetaceae bacterium]